MAWARPSSPVSTARLRAHDGQGQEPAVVAAQPRQQPGPQKRRLARPRRAEDDEQRLHSRRAHPAQHVQPAQNLGVAPEEHRRVGLLQRCPPPIRGAVRVIWRGPWEMLGPDPQGAQTVQQPLQTHAVQHHRLAAIGDVHFGGGAVVGEQVAALPLRGDVGVGHRLQPGAQDGLVQVLGVAELDLAFSASSASASTAGRSPPRSEHWPYCSASFHRSPGRIPVCGSRSR